MDNVKSLAAKMTAIMGDVPTMIKNGRNVQQKYLYVTAEDVKAAIRPLLKKHNVAVFSSMLGVERTAGTTKGGGASMTTIARMRFVLVCGETGESMECEWFGESTDYGDKSVNKAATAAEKYWLINTFLLSTTEPEADEETIEHAAPESAAPVAQEQPAAARPILIDSGQETQIATLAAQLWNGQWRYMATEYIREKYGRGLKSLTATDAEALIKDLSYQVADKAAMLEEAMMQTQPTTANPR